jgi:hypothetical protein
MESATWRSRTVSRDRPRRGEPSPTFNSNETYPVRISRLIHRTTAKRFSPSYIMLNRSDFPQCYQRLRDSRAGATGVPRRPRPDALAISERRFA